MRRTFLILLLAVIVGCGAAFVSAPWFAFRALRAAAQAGDIQAMSELIDFSATRQSLQDQVDPESVSPPPDPWRDPIGAMRRALAPLKPSKTMDTYLTPDELVALTAGPAPKAGAKPNVFTDLFPGGGRSIRYWDPKRCRISVAGPNGQTHLFTFERRGLFDWKLVQLRLNDDHPAG
jgi:hypothetical protein